MDSRMNKYRENNISMSRLSRNENLYKEINDSKLDNFTVKSNATVLGNHEQEIDVEKIKKILDTKYKETPKRKSIRIEQEKEQAPVVTESNTKEYDLNAFLAKAKDDKEESYQEARAKKLRDTQYDILNNLNIPKKEDSTKDDNDLMELINTIAINEVKKKEIKNADEISPLDILEDLKGNDDTEVLEGIKEEVTKHDLSNTVIESIDDIKESKNNNLDQSFYTNTNMFKDDDFDNDFLDDDKMNIGIKILIIILVVLILAGMFLFIKSFLDF